jgi:hypothetical protein
MSFVNWFERVFSMEHPAPAAPPGFVAHLPENDDRHARSEHFEESDIVGQSFLLEYEDATGAVSKRRITVRGLTATSDGHLCVTAMCWERNAIRSFRTDRMLSLAHVTTGELISDPLRFFADYARDILPSDSTTEILKIARPGMRALLFLARCDGSVHPAELDVIRKYVDEIAAGRAYDWHIALEFLKKQHPDRSLAKTSLKCMWHKPDEAGRLLRACANLVRADGIVVDAETASFDRIRYLIEEPCPFEAEFEEHERGPSVH